MSQHMIFNQRVVPRRFVLHTDPNTFPVLTAESAIPLATLNEVIGREDTPPLVGVIVGPDAKLESLEAHLERVSFIAIEFPKFTDGRGYSLARLLRTRLGFEGPLLAFGDVLRDQLLLMHRSGFNAFHMREDQDEVASLEAFGRYEDTYQFGGYPS
jgi:uncharacterized protein (DUF934 family)